jgi:hypothetical protein
VKRAAVDLLKNRAKSGMSFHGVVVGRLRETRNETGTPRPLPLTYRAVLSPGPN